MASVLDRLTDSQATGLVAKFEDPFRSLPHLPAGVREFIVKIAPYFALVSAILGLLALPALLALLGLGGAIAGIAVGPMYMIWGLVLIVLTIAGIALDILAFKPLMQREMKGWMYMFWMQMLGIVSTIVGLLSGTGSILGFVGILIGLYILFEVKPHYGGAAEVVEKVTNPM